MATATVEQALREVVAAEPAGIVAAYLFGSVARGTAGPRSDVDVAVLYTVDPPAILESLPLDLENRISRLVGRPAQVIVLNSAPADLVHRVLRDGVLLLDRDPSARIRFEVRARNESFDLQPILALYRLSSPPVPGVVTDADLLAQKLAFIETCVQELRKLARPAKILRDVREARFVLHTLQIAIQAALDVASHIVSDERLGEPETNRELFDRLIRPGWLPADLAGTMERMAGFRNVVVHGYGRVNLEIAKDIVEHQLTDLLAFVTAIRTRLTDQP
jgi:uncharacterized protein YutE (UPF0331/DUF86 family)/predicted nucleotidyltransferase